MKLRSFPDRVISSVHTRRVFSNVQYFASPAASLRERASRKKPPVLDDTIAGLSGDAARSAGRTEPTNTVSEGLLNSSNSLQSRGDGEGREGGFLRGTWDHLRSTKRWTLGERSPDRSSLESRPGPFGRATDKSLSVYLFLSLHTRARERAEDACDEGSV